MSKNRTEDAIGTLKQSRFNRGADWQTVWKYLPVLSTEVYEYRLARNRITHDEDSILLPFLKRLQQKFSSDDTTEEEERTRRVSQRYEKSRNESIDGEGALYNGSHEHDEEIKQDHFDANAATMRQEDHGDLLTINLLAEARIRFLNLVKAAYLHLFEVLPPPSY